MPDPIPEYQLEYLLAFDQRTHHFEMGYWVKFEVSRVAETEQRPHGLSYSFTLHAPDGRRLMGFDNAHGVPEAGSRFKRRSAANDHWHRTGDDPGRPYRFKDVETLIDDFFDEVERVLAEYGIATTVLAVGEGRRPE